MKTRILTAAIAVVFMLLALAPAALAVPVETNPSEPTVAADTTAPTETPNVSAASPTAASTPGTSTADIPTAFTPDGTGTVVNYADDGAGKEFYVIQTDDGYVFYLVIDTEKGAENVYFLNAVTVADLMPLAEPSDDAATGNTSVTPPAPTPTPAPTTPAPAVTPSPEPTAPPVQSGGHAGMLVLAAIVVLLGGGAAYYFKIYRPKRHGTVNPEAEDYTPEDKPDDLDEPEDDAADWDEGDDGSDGGSEQ